MAVSNSVKRSPAASASSTKPGVTGTRRTVTRHVPWTQHALRQLKLVLPGAVITYYLGTPNDFWSVLQGSGGFWAQTTAFAASCLGLTTIGLFLYVLIMPWLTGEEPNYQTWRDSGVLSSVIPLLTSSIVVGWLLAVGTLGHWSRSGYVKGTIGVSAFYALTFGLLGLVPVPKARQKTKL
ncbi:hypothetical protein NLJ89_g6757 [Agrocybe chaxingu]|uniref:Transmembrane protein n=1 Tax=Agrocybe chaxingu TaxID=84603 RepID=A0A9W8JYM1_9AGAR|nr:hypothetical protein NLJ89_g6757 [Agrocybe chaxingu]